MTRTHLIERTCPKTGFRETAQYTGPKRYLPKGWRIVREMP